VSCARETARKSEHCPEVHLHRWTTQQTLQCQSLPKRTGHQCTHSNCVITWNMGKLSMCGVGWGGVGGQPLCGPSCTVAAVGRAALFRASRGCASPRTQHCLFESRSTPAPCKSAQNYHPGNLLLRRRGASSGCGGGGNAGRTKVWKLFRNVEM